MGTSAPGAYFFSFFAGGGAAAGALKIGAGAGAATGAETLVGFVGAWMGTGGLVVEETGARRVVGGADEMGTVREAVVLAWTRVEDGVTEVRTLVTPGDDSGGIPLEALSSADLRIARWM